MWSLSKVLILLSVCETFARRSPRFADPRNPVSDERYIGLSFEEDRFWVAEFKMSFTSSPTISPRPTMAPTNIPTMIPTRSPTDGITLEPTVAPTFTPTITPTNLPTTTPTITSTPTISPRPTPQTQPPTQAPTTAAPTAAPVTDSPTATPTAVPTATPTISSNPTPSNQSRCGLTDSERRQEIQTIIESVSDPTEVALVGSSRNLAFEWLVEEDELFLCPDSSNLVQRFVIALFYFATGGDNWSQCSQTDLACVGTPLLSGVNECSWYGIFCDGSSNTIEIIYDNNNLIGTLPPELSELQNLNVLSLETGSLGSTIPESLGSISGLNIIDLDYNEFTGTIPESIYNLTNLIQLDLNSNNLIGTISTEIGNMVSLELFQVYENQMTGTIPTEMGLVTTLLIGEFFNNTFTGSVPQEVCDIRAPPGQLQVLTTDCFSVAPALPEINCTCCTGCAQY